MKLSRGALVILDLDRFKEFSKAKGFSEYTPNEITGLLSHLVDAFVRKWNGVVVYGIDWERGTEEAIIEIPEVEAEELEQDLIEIAEEVRRAGASITIVALTGYIFGVPARSRREAYSEGLRSYAKKVLEKLKKRGGEVVFINGRIAWRRPQG
ncbi:MAG: hypothetical protein QXN05_05175 [Acidilobaceae archaeon]